MWAIYEEYIMKTMELFELVNGKDAALTEKYNEYMANEVSMEKKKIMHDHSTAFSEFVEKAIASFLKENKQHNFSEQEFFMELNNNAALQEEYKNFVQTFFSAEELSAFQEHAMAMNEMALQAVIDFAKVEGIELED